MSIILYTGHYSTKLCNEHRDKIFVFGDNTRRVGNGGQAIIRGQANAFGVATKRTPGGAHEFFVEGNPQDMMALATDLHDLERQLEMGKTIVLPVFNYGASTLGCGLAQLPMRAPSLYAFINTWQRRVVKKYKQEKKS